MGNFLEALGNQSTLLALAQHFAVIGYALLRRQSDFHDTVAQIAPVSQIKGNVGKLQGLQFILKRGFERRRENFPAASGYLLGDSRKPALSTACANPVAFFELVAALNDEIDSFAEPLSIGQLGISLCALAGRLVVPFEVLKLRDFGVQRREFILDELSGRSRAARRVTPSSS